VRIDRVATAVPPAYRAAPGDPPAELFTRPPLIGELAAVVLTGGQVIGTVTADDLRCTLRLAPLRSLRTAPGATAASAGLAIQAGGGNGDE
jgi:hypothetical protein